MNMRLDALEREALKYALNDFNGDVYLFGSRIDDTKKGGDIDILLVPKERTNTFKLSLGIQRKFFSKCEENIDVVIYDESPFCQEALKNAKKLVITGI